jgi:hypothetical protein
MLGDEGKGGAGDGLGDAQPGPIPWTRQVLPVPRSPSRAIRSPGLQQRTQALAQPSVCSGL